MRQTKRRHKPQREPLDWAMACQNAMTDAESERGRAFLSAASAGWSMREIAAVVGLSASTVWRIVVAAEKDAA